MDDKRLTLYILVAGETFHSFTQFLPGLDEIREHDYDHYKTTIRTGQFYSGAWSFLIALAIGHAVDSAVPLMIWLAIMAGMTALYEFHMKEEPWQ